MEKNSIISAIPIDFVREVLDRKCWVSSGSIFLLPAVLWRLHLAIGKCYQTQRRYEAAENSLLAARDIIEQLALNVPGELPRKFPATRTPPAFSHASTITPARCQARL